MKIGIDVRLWNETGVGRYIRNLVVNLSEIDNTHEYVLFARPKDKEQIRKLIKRKDWKIVSVNIRWHTITEQFLFASVINKENLDLMHFPYFSLPILYRKPFVVTIHDLIIHHFPTGKASTLPDPIYRVKRLGYEQVLQYAVKKGKKIIVPLTAVKKDLVRAFHVPEEKIATTPEGFDVNLAVNKTDKLKLPAKKYLLYVGNAYPHKNLDLLIKAYIELRTKDSHQDLGLVLVGKDDFFYKKLREKIKKEKIPSVTFFHDIPDHQLASLYQNAVCLVSPSLMEGFGLTALEALALSCLPLVSDIPAFHEVCGDAAVYFNPTSPKSLKEKIELILTLNKKEYDHYIRNGQEKLKKFSWKTMAKETLAIYDESIKSTKGTKSIKSRLFLSS
jgi:glycosyltransferase involved in cell wall biosynthesis